MHIAERIIALEIRASKFGFAVLEGEDRLLDWGVRIFGEGVDTLESTISDRITTLLTFYDPGFMVIRGRKLKPTANGKKPRLILGTIKVIMKGYSTKLRVISARKVRDRFASGDKITKHDIAKSLAERFKELSFKLPNKRKAYQSEAPAMLVFDALATAVAFVEVTHPVGQ